MKMKSAHEESRKLIEEARTILTRLHKGQAFIEKAYEDKSISSAFNGIQLYEKLSKELFRMLEESLMMNEYLLSGRTIMIKRTGQAINIAPVAEKEIEVDPNTLLTMRTLKEIFGEDFHNFIEFVEMERDL